VKDLHILTYPLTCAALLFQLKSQLARLRTQLMTPAPGSSDSGGHEGFSVPKSGDGRVALIGFPSVGKSSLLNAVTDTKSEAAAYEFTTLTCIPGSYVYRYANVMIMKRSLHSL
jgi:ribosome-interacting GTPase 1